MNKKDKKPTKLDAQSRKEIGLELRKSHFQLGNESKTYFNLLSQI